MDGRRVSLSGSPHRALSDRSDSRTGSHALTPLVSRMQATSLERIRARRPEPPTPAPALQAREASSAPIRSAAEEHAERTTARPQAAHFRPGAPRRRCYSRGGGQPSLRRAGMHASSRRALVSLLRLAEAESLSLKEAEGALRAG